MNFHAIGRSRSVIFLSCIAFFGGAIWLMSLGEHAADELQTGDTISVQQFIAQPSLDTTPVNIRFDGEFLRIPRNYLEAARLSSYVGMQNSASIIIVTTFPDFAGAKPNTIDLLRIAGVRETAIKIYPLGPKTDAQKTYKRNEPAIAAATKTTEPRHFDLVKVAAKTSLVPLDVYVGYDRHSAKPIVISCGRLEDRVPPLDCSVYFETHGLPFLYRYDVGLLQHWRTIDENVLRLLNSFFVGGVAR